LRDDQGEAAAGDQLPQSCKERLELLGDKKRFGGNLLGKRLGEETEVGGELLVRRGLGHGMNELRQSQSRRGALAST